MTIEADEYPNNGSPELQPGEIPGVNPEPQPTGGTSAGAPSGNLRALCMGINQYPTSPLSGCVSDARRWQSWFEEKGFETQLLLDDEATRDRMLSSMRAIVENSQPGDVVAIQYSGHGTQLPDLNRDELGGDTPQQDEALVPIDHLHSGYLIDDDMAEICNQIPDNVNVTFFFDCCHSGTGVRMMRGRDMAPTDEARPRFLPPSEEMIDVHLKTRREIGSNSRVPENQREVLFAACKSSQVAWESNGQGDFTRHALGILEGMDHGALTNAVFTARVTAAFGSNPRQNPDITCEAQYRDMLLLGSRQNAEQPTSNPELQELLQELRELLARFSA